MANAINSTPILNPWTGRPYSQHYSNLLQKRMQLPVWNKKQKFMRMLDKFQCILVEAETGSGKTTQIPQWCAEWLKFKQKKKGGVCCTQPRKLAAMTVARRVAEEMDVKLGQEVGYSIRFEEQCSFQTVLKYCTDGILLAESTRNQLLEQYGIIVLDEVHERTLTTDVIMGLVKEIMKKRSELRVVVMSASLYDCGDFQKYFSDCPNFCLKIPGRSHPVEIIYDYGDLEFGDYFETAIQKVVDIHANLHKCEVGDILLFLTGQDEIDEACEKLKEEIESRRFFAPDLGDLECLPLYSILPIEDQKKIFAQRQCEKGANGAIIGRRCIVATNIAETSMTIDGIVFVVDPGYCKRKNYDPKTRVESLLVQKITRASAIQRAGRAGRTRPGKCYRLYTEDCFNAMKQVDPEIKHSNLANVLLRLMKAGIQDIHKFALMDQPPRELMEQSINMLTDLGAINHAVLYRVTPLGLKIVQLPLDPPMARTLIESTRLGCFEDVITICAMMSAPRCFIRPRKKREEADAKKAQFIDDYGDHLTLLNVFDEFTKSDFNAEWCFQNFLNANSLRFAFDVRSHLTNIVQHLELEIVVRPNSADDFLLHKFNILKSLIAGFFMKIAYFKPTTSGHNPRARYGHYITAESVKLEHNGLENASNTQHLIHGSSTLYRSILCGSKPEWVLYNEAIMQNNQKHYLQMVSVIRPEWLMELAPRYFRRMPATTELRKKLAENDAENRELMAFLASLNNA